METAAQVPLMELLRNVPADARASYEHSSTEHQHIPYGRMCHEAADEIERLRSCRDELREVTAAIHDPTVNLTRTLAEAVSALQAERDALRVDAERYRWLRGDGGPSSSRWPQWRVEHWNGHWNPVQMDLLDAAIDAALRGEGV